jgi:hypothetical protein
MTSCSDCAQPGRTAWPDSCGIDLRAGGRVQVTSAAVAEETGAAAVGRPRPASSRQAAAGRSTTWVSLPCLELR